MRFSLPIVFSSCVLLLSGCPGPSSTDVPDAPSGVDAPVALDAPAAFDAPSTDDAPTTVDAPSDLDAAVDDAGATSTDAGELADVIDLPDAPLRTCGGIAGGACGPTEVCELAPGSLSCTAAGTCVPRPLRCATVDDPVCGCDGVDYANPCSAYRAGTDFVTRGTCRAPADCGPDDAFVEGSCRTNLGYEFDGERCTALIGCTCTGTDCATLASTEAACYTAHATCPCVIDRAFAEGACDLSFGWAWNGTDCVDVSGCTCTGPDCDALAADEATCLTERATCRSPTGRAFACGPDLLCALGAEYCQAFSGGAVGAVRYSCLDLPTGARCQALPSCTTCFATPPAGGTCTEGRRPAEITVTILAP